MPFFKPSVLTLALFASGLYTSSILAAQTDADKTQADNTDDIEVIQVKGLRSSLEAAQALKMHSSSIIEAISAEDLGKLPDLSITESLARLPGLTAQRVNGRDQVISIRGMSPDFTTALLNGREMVTPGDNRGVEFDQFPSELLNGVLVYKTPDAALIGQGLAGTADMQLINPLTYGEQAFMINGVYAFNDEDAYNPKGDDHGERLNLAYIDQFLDDTFGVALGYAHMSTPSQMQRFEAWGYPDLDEQTNVIGGGKFFSNTTEVKRDALMGIFNYRPNDDFSSSLDIFYSDFSEQQHIALMEIGLQWSSAQLDSDYTLEDGLVTAGTFDGAKPVIRNDLEKRDSELIAIGWKNEYAFTPNWVATLDLSYSSVDRTDLNLETYAGTGKGADGVTDRLDFVMTSSGPVFSNELDYSDLSLVGLTDSGGWGQIGFSKTHKIKDTLSQVRLDLKRDLDSFFHQIEIGINYSEREKTKTADEYISYDFSNDLDLNPIPNPVGEADLSHFGLGSMPVYDPLAVWNSGLYVVEQFVHPDVTEKSWSVNEDVLVSYVKLDLDTEIGDYSLTGNLGLQAVYTDQSSTALGQYVDDVLVAKTGGTDYWEFLPSLNLSFHISENQQLRLGLARTLARPRMDQMRATDKYSFDNNFEDSSSIDASPWSNTGGNPELKPWIANAADLSFEQYFTDNKGYVSLAVFYKDLETYIYDQVEIQDFSGYPLPTNCQTDDGEDRICEPAIYQGYKTTPQNGEGGKIYGAELTFSADAGLLSPMLEGFGAVMNASSTKSDIQPDPDNPSTPLPGLSEDVANITLYYEYQGFSIRGSSRYRSEYLGEVQGFGNNRELRMIQPETMFDAQINYRFVEGSPLEGLTLSLQGYNLTDEASKTVEEGSGDRVMNYETYGRTYMLSASYIF